MQKLKCCEAAGLDGICAEHLIHCYPNLSCVLNKQFNFKVTQWLRPVCSRAELYRTLPLPKMDDCHKKYCQLMISETLQLMSAVISRAFKYCVLDRFNFLFNFC